jgi:hypothetical protein
MIKVKKDNQVFTVSKAAFEDTFKPVGFTIVNENKNQVVEKQEVKAPEVKAEVKTEVSK